MWSKLRTSLIYIILTLAVLNAGSSFIGALNSKNNPNSFPLHKLADTFTPFKGLVANQQQAGYLTDKNIEDTPVIARFQLAQFTLAPTVLQLNQTNHPVVFIDASNPEYAMSTIKNNELTPVKFDQTGLITTINKKLIPNP